MEAAINPTWQHSIRRDGDVCSVVLSGELDLGLGDTLTDLLAEQIGRPGTAVVRVDLAAVTFLDSWAIGVLVRSRQVAAGAGCRFFVSNPHGHVRRVLDVAGVLPALSAEPSH